MLRSDLKVFLFAWLNFIWMFAAMGPVIGPPERTIREWIIRGIIGGFFAGLAMVFITRKRRAKEIPEALPNGEL